MPAPKGRLRRRRGRRGSSIDKTISFSVDHAHFIAEQSAARGVCDSVVVADAVECYRNEQLLVIARIEKEDRKAARAALAGAPQEDPESEV
jgi:hypothetical protein